MKTYQYPFYYFFSKKNVNLDLEDEGGGDERKPSGSSKSLRTWRTRSRKDEGVKIGNSAYLNQDRPFLRHVSPRQSVPAPLAETWPITTCISWRRIRRIRPSSLRNASIGEARSNREQPDIDSNTPSSPESRG